MTQTWAILLEAYRNLNSKKLFWLVLILSGLIVACFACVGIIEQGVKILFWQFDNHIVNSKQIPVEQFYKNLFVQIGIGTWLSWIAAILALISTAGIFPDLMTSGSIDLYVSKPISRLRLFFTEYVAGLLFAALQVTVFCVACFLIIGLRGGVWEPGLFLAIPLVVCFFSYLFAVSVFLGVLTRSTIAALLLTLLFWFGIWAVGTAEESLLMFKTMQKKGVDFAAVHVEASNDRTKRQETSNGTESSPPADQSPAAETDASKESSSLDIAHNIVYGVKTVLPKTTDTIKLLERSLVEVAKLPQEPGGPKMNRMHAAQKEVIDILRGRSIAWVLGTSLGFEAIVLFFAAFIFCRRDY